MKLHLHTPLPEAQKAILITKAKHACYCQNCLPHKILLSPQQIAWNAFIPRVWFSSYRKESGINTAWSLTPKMLKNVKPQHRWKRSKYQKWTGNSMVNHWSFMLNQYLMWKAEVQCFKTDAIRAFHVKINKQINGGGYTQRKMSNL